MPSLPLNIRQLFLKKTGKTPHEWQVQTIAADLDGNHLIVIAPTGSGKTLPLVASVLFRDDGLTVILSALNVITTQIAEALEEYGDSVLTLHGKVLTAEMKRKALLPSCRCIILSVEMLGGADFDVLLKHPEFHKRLRHIRVDEAHCVLLWKTFRPDYARMEFLRHQLPNVQWYFTSATLSQEQITYLKAKFGLEKEKTRVIRLSNDRPNVQLIAKEMAFPASSFEDLLVFLGPKPSVRPNGPVVVYFNSKKDCQEAVTFFRATLKAINPALETKANWFHSNNSQEYAESVIQKLNTGQIWYLFATEILGMGADLTGVSLGGSWGYPPSMQSALQRAGRVGRNSKEPATFIFFIPKSKKSDASSPTKMEASGLSALDPIVVKEESIDTSLPTLSLPPPPDTSIHAPESTQLLTPISLLTPIGTASQGTVPDGPKRKRLKTEPKKTPLSTSNNGNLKFKSDDSSGVSEQRVDEDVLKLFNSKTCLCKGISTYFSNGDSDSFLCSCVQCQNSASDPTFGALCCSVCDVSLLQIFQNTVRIVHPQKKNKSQVGKQNVVDKEHPAVVEIETWALEKVREKFGWCYGGYALLVDQDTILRMVMLAKKGVLNTVHDVEHETDWYYAKELGEDILEILRRQFSNMGIPGESQAPSGSKPKKKLQLISQGQVVAEGARGRRCGHCKQLGHYKPTCPDLIRLRAEGKGGEEGTKKATEGKEND